MGFKSHIWEKKKIGSRPGSLGSPGFRVPRVWPGCCHNGLLLNPDRSSHRVDRVPGRPAGPGQAGFNNSGSQWLKFLYFFYYALSNTYKKKINQLIQINKDHCWWAEKIIGRKIGDVFHGRVKVDIKDLVSLIISTKKNYSKS
jgi:hypothetical protein